MKQPELNKYDSQGQSSVNEFESEKNYLSMLPVSILILGGIV